MICVHLQADDISMIKGTASAENSKTMTWNMATRSKVNK